MQRGKSNTGGWTVFVPQPIDPSGFERLRPEVSLVVTQETAARASEAGFSFPVVDWEEGLAQADAILLRTRRLDGSDIGQAPRLRVVARHGVGVDNIDVGAATRRRIAVTITPQANVQSVAEHTLGCLLALARRLPELDQLTRAGRFGERDRILGYELHGTTLGLIGFGRIGREVARKAQAAFGMSVIVFDPHVAAEGVPTDMRKVDDLTDLLRASDVVSLHAPLTPDTRNLLDASRLALMKPGAFLLSMSRGGIVDEVALADSLREGVLGGAAVDVFATEPPSQGHPLFNLPNVIVTPHCASHTGAAMRRMAQEAAGSILACLNGRHQEAAVVNPEALS